MSTDEAQLRRDLHDLRMCGEGTAPNLAGSTSATEVRCVVRDPRFWPKPGGQGRTGELQPTAVRIVS